MHDAHVTAGDLRLWLVVKTIELTMSHVTFQNDITA